MILKAVVNAQVPRSGAATQDGEDLTQRRKGRGEAQSGNDSERIFLSANLCVLCASALNLPARH